VLAHRNRRAENDHLIFPPGKISGDDAGKPEHACGQKAQREPIKSVMG
jgi:hypothetical protein